MRRTKRWQGLQRQLADVAGSDGRRPAAAGESPLVAVSGTGGHKATTAESPVASLKNVVARKMKRLNLCARELFG